MQTATIEVKYVNHPKEGKQYGSIKGTNNDSWPVKADRIREFEPGVAYELAYTEGNNGFKNIIGVKRIVAEPQRQPAQRAIDAQNILLSEGNGQFRETRNLQQPTPQQRPSAPKDNGQYYRPAAPRDSERMFVCAIAGHWIDTGRVDMTEDAMIDLVKSLRNVYAATFGADDQ